MMIQSEGIAGAGAQGQKHPMWIKADQLLESPHCHHHGLYAHSAALSLTRGADTFSPMCPKAPVCASPPPSCLLSWVFWPRSLPPSLLSSLPSGCWCWAVGWRDEVRCRHIHILKTQPFKDMASLNKHLKATLFPTRQAEPRPGFGKGGGGWIVSLSGREDSLLVQTPSLQGVLCVAPPYPHPMPGFSWPGSYVAVLRPMGVD